MEIRKYVDANKIVQVFLTRVHCNVFCGRNWKRDDTNSVCAQKLNETNKAIVSRSFSTSCRRSSYTMNLYLFILYLNNIYLFLFAGTICCCFFLLFHLHALARRTHLFVLRRAHLHVLMINKKRESANRNKEKSENGERKKSAENPKKTLINWIASTCFCLVSMSLNGSTMATTPHSNSCIFESDKGKCSPATRPIIMHAHN